MHQRRIPARGARRALALVTLLTLASACDSVVGSVAAPEDDWTLPSWADLASCDRHDTAWARMSDAELLAAVDKAGGRVSIGIKEARATDAVDCKGRLLTRETTFWRMYGHVRDLGVTIDHTAPHRANILGTIPPALRASVVPALRRHANVDYFEALLPGCVMTCPPFP